MKARDLFGVLIRVLGMILVLYAIWNLAFAVAFNITLLTSHDSDMSAYYTFGIPALVMGFGLLRFGRQIVRFSYPTNKDDTEE